MTLALWRVGAWLASDSSAHRHQASSRFSPKRRPWLTQDKNVLQENILRTRKKKKKQKQYEIMPVFVFVCLFVLIELGGQGKGL